MLMGISLERRGPTASFVSHHSILKVFDRYLGRAHNIIFQKFCTLFPILRETNLNLIGKNYGNTVVKLFNVPFKRERNL